MPSRKSPREVRSVRNIYKYNYARLSDKLTVNTILNEEKPNLPFLFSYFNGTAKNHMIIAINAEKAFARKKIMTL